VTDEEKTKAIECMNNLLSIREVAEEKNRHGNPDIMGLVEEILANKIQKCEIICLHGVPDQSGYYCETHHRAASAKEFAAGYCSAMKAVGASEREIRNGMSRAVLKKLGRTR
jgi:hypothetical protein